MYTEDQYLAALKDYLESGKTLSMGELERRHGVSSSTLTNRFAEHIIDGKPVRVKSRETKKEQNNKALKRDMEKDKGLWSLVLNGRRNDEYTDS